jgi:GNAT superfamily N-acetyltransferase
MGLPPLVKWSVFQLLPEAPLLSRFNPQISLVYHIPWNHPVDPDFQNRGIGQQAVRQMFDAFPEARKWILGTPSWAIRNQHFYEKMGFVKIRETEIDPNLGWAGVEYEFLK